MIDKVKSSDGEKPKTETVVTVPEKKPDVVKTEEKVADAELPEVIALKKQLSDAENKAKDEREKRVAAEKTRDEANTKVASSQNNAVKAHESAVNNAIEVAAANLSQIKRDLREAMEGGDMDKQVELQEKLADARWQYKGAEQNKAQFDVWKEKQKTVVTTPAATSKYTVSEQKWIDEHPRFETDDDYYGVVAGADAAARRKGIQPDTKAYYEYVETALKKSGLEKDETSAENDNGRDTTGSQEEEEVVIQQPKPKQKAAVSAPVTNSAPSTTREKNSRQYKLSPEQQDMAHKMFGPNSNVKLSNQDAEIKYAAYQMDIRDRRANGEKI